MERICCLLIGYFCGCFLTAEIVCKKLTGLGISENKTDNPGMASVMINFGVKAGIIVLSGDLFKTFLAIALCRLWLFTKLGVLAVSYAGLGAVLGHCFPIFNRFHGGRGIAVTGAYSVSLFAPLGLATYILGGIAVLLSGYLSVGSAAIAVIFPVLVYMFGFGAEATVLSAIAGAVILVRHIPNFKHIYSSEERRFHFLQRIFKLK